MSASADPSAVPSFSALLSVQEFFALTRAQRAALARRAADHLGADWAPDAVRMGEDSLGFIHLPTAISFVLVPGGAFEMGLTQGDLDECDQHFEWSPELTQAFDRQKSALLPAHPVQVRCFLVARAVLESDELTRLSHGRISGGGAQPRAVVRDFATSLGFRLASEAELEWLLRDGGRYHFVLDGARKLAEIEGDSRLLRSRFGVDDLFEDQWAEDDYHPSYDGAPTSSEPWLGGDPEGVCRSGNGPETVEEPANVIAFLAANREKTSRARVRLARAFSW